MFGEEGEGIGEFGEVLVVEGELEELRPDGLACLVGECFEFLEEGLVLAQGGLVVCERLLAHLNY